MKRALLWAGALLFCSAATATDWSFHRPPSSVPALLVLESDMVLDAEGRPHFIYNDQGTGLFYARKTALGWESSLVSGPKSELFHPSLVLDSQGRPHAAYFDEESQSLIHAFSTDGFAWLKTTAHAPEEDGWAGEGTSIALWEDNPRIAYRQDVEDDGVYSLSFAEWTGTAWSTSTVDASSSVGEHISLALDAAGTPSVSYYDEDRKILRYARWEGDAWSVETVDQDGDVGYVSSLALDGEGYPHIAYLDFDEETLKYVRWTGSAWVVEMVSASGETVLPIGCSLALGTDGRPRVLFVARDVIDRTLRYAEKREDGWFFQDVFKNGNGFGFTSFSLGLDSTARPHAGYINLGPLDLWYAVSTFLVGGAVGPGVGRTLSFPFAGDASCGGVDVPSGAFSQNATLEIREALSVPSAPSMGAVLEPTGMAFRAATVPPLQPSGDVTFSFCGTVLRPGAEDRTLLARYDESLNRWVPLETVRSGGGIEARADHFSLFQIMRVAETGAFEAVRIFPNPLSKASGGAMTFAGFPAGAEFSFYSASMKPLRVLRADSFGTASWDGRDEGGRSVPEGVYFVFAREGSRRAHFKVMVRR